MSLSAAAVEQLRHVAADADGVPLSAEDLAFLRSDQSALALTPHGDLHVIGIASSRHYPVSAVRAAIADARAVWRVIAGSHL